MLLSRGWHGLESGLHQDCMDCITFTEHANLKANLQCCAQADWFGTKAQNIPLMKRKVDRMQLKSEITTTAQWNVVDEIVLK